MEKSSIFHPFGFQVKNITLKADIFYKSFSAVYYGHKWTNKLVKMTTNVMLEH